MRRNFLVPLVLAVAVAIASGWTILTSVHTYCEERPRLTVLATLAGFLIALCFRQLGRAKTGAQRWLLAVCLVVAGCTLFADARVVIAYNRVCAQTEQDLRDLGR